MTLKTNRKRASPGNTAPAPKRRVIEKNTRENGINRVQEERRLHRKRPVTISKQDIEESGSSGDESSQEDVLNNDTENDSTEGVNTLEDLEGTWKEGHDTKTKTTTSGQRNTARESHKVQKALQQERRAAKQHADVLAIAKPLWAQARKKDCAREERKKIISQLMDVIRGRVRDVVFKHDASRIVQTVVKYGGQAERNDIAQELKGGYKDLAQSKYSKFLVTKLIRLCPTHRASIFLEFRGSVVRLLLHREAGSVLADAFELYANAYERSLLLHDFYGKEATLFSPALVKLSNGGVLGEDEKQILKKGLAGILEGADLERRKRVLTAVKEKLDLILNNPEKGAISHAIFHRIVWEYLVQLNELEDEGLTEKLRREIFEACHEQLAEMVHTKDGSRVVREFIAQGTAKDRKQIVKVLKPHIQRMCLDDEAQLVLFTALDIIDDTKLTAKQIVSEITSHAQELYTSPQGRRSLLYLIVPRTPRHFTPAQCTLLAETDVIRARTSKKDEKTRHDELLKEASGPLVELLESRTCAENMIRDPGGSLLITEIMLYAEADKSKAYTTLIDILTQPYPTSPLASLDTKPHIIDLPHSSRVYKTLLQGGHYSHSTKSIIPAPVSAFSPIQFAYTWLLGHDSNQPGPALKNADTVINKSDKKETVQQIALSPTSAGGAFVLAALVDRVRSSILNGEGKNGNEAAQRVLDSWFDDSFLDRLSSAENEKVKGREVFLSALKQQS